MTDLATLGIRVQSEQAEIAEDRMDGMAAAAGRAENATDRLAMAARRADGAASTMNVAVRQQTAVLAASRASAGLASHEMLNLSRQFADIGVSAAMGMNPLMILIQQGPQIGETFSMASARGVTFSMVLRQIAVAAAPVLLILSPIVAVAGAVAGGFALMHRELSKGFPSDITDGLNLTEEQLKRVESRSVTFGDTVMATFTVTGRYIMDGPVGDALEWLGNKFTQIWDWISRTVFEAAAAQAGVMVGTYRTIRDTWRDLPAVFGDIIITAANNVIRGLTDLVNKAGALLNGFISAQNAMTGGRLPLLAAVEAPEIANRFAGAGRAQGMAWAANVLAARAEAAAGLRQFGADIQAEALARVRRRALEEAGDPNATSDGSSRNRRPEVERLTRVENINLQPLRGAFFDLVEPLKLIADEMRLIDGLARDTAQGLASAFGESGRALGDLLTAMSGYQSRLAEINLAEKEYRLSAMQADRERAMAQVQNYGDMLGAAKGFFEEGSDGYRALQAAEQAYRLFQFAMMVQSMVMGGQETAATVGQNVIKAASHGVVAVARALASLPFPLNLAAGAATIAALAAIGVKLFGGSGGGGGGGGGTYNPAPINSRESSVATARGQASSAQSSGQSFAGMVAQSVKVQIELNDPMFRARVQQEAAPMVQAGSQASFSGARKAVPADRARTDRMTLGRTNR